MSDIFYTVSNDLHRMARVQAGRVIELDFEIQGKPTSQLNGIYIGRVIEVQRPIKAAFVDIGIDKPGMLALHEANLPGLNQGDAVLVQVSRTENPLEGKGVRLTRLITLSLGALLYTPFKPGYSLSKKIQERDLFKNLISLESDEGLIVRHSATPDQSLQKLLFELRQEWQLIKDKLSLKPPICLIPGPDLLTRVIRSLNPSDSLVVDDRMVAKRSMDKNTFSKDLAFDERCEEAWDSLLSPEIPIPQGGTLYIEETRGLTVIDVNSQGALRHKEPFNRGAIQETLHQIRLRDLSGKMVVDLIDSPKVLDPLIKGLSLPSDLEIWGLSSMGLLEMIRRRRRLSLPQRLKLEMN